MGICGRKAVRRAIRVPRCERQRPPTLASSDDEAKGEVVVSESPPRGGCTYCADGATRPPLPRQFRHRGQGHREPCRAATSVDAGANDVVLWISNYEPSKRPEWFLVLARLLPKLRFVMIGS